MTKQLKVGDELSPDDIEVGMIIDIVSRFSNNTKRNNVIVLSILIGGGFKHSESTFGNYYAFKVIFKGYAESPESYTQQHNTLSEQSIEEAVKTLSQASQEIQTKFSVNSEGELTIYSNYHEKELTFNLDSLDQLVQYIECVKKLDNFK